MTINRIMVEHAKDVAYFLNTGELGNLFEVLYEYYFREMPYGVQKARDGDPYEWVAERFLLDLETVDEVTVGC